MIWSDGDISNGHFFGILREEWSSEGTMTAEEIRVVVNTMGDLDRECESLMRLLRENIVLSTLAKNYDDLTSALIKYDIVLWEIQEFEYIKDLRRIMPEVIRKLVEKYKGKDVEDVKRYSNDCGEYHMNVIMEPSVDEEWLDRSFVKRLREGWSIEGTLTQKQIKIATAKMEDLDCKCEQLVKILREKVVASTINKDYRGLMLAFIEYDSALQEIHGRKYVKKLKRVLPGMISKLSGKYCQDENEGEEE